MSNPIVTIELENGQVMRGELYPEKAPNLSLIHISEPTRH